MATSLVTPDLMAQDGFTIQDSLKIPSIKRTVLHDSCYISDQEYNDFRLKPKPDDHRIRI